MISNQTKKRCIQILFIIIILNIFITTIPSMAEVTWLWPVPSSRRISRGYYSGHEGVDIKYGVGDSQPTQSSSAVPVVAAYDGTVYCIYKGCNNWNLNNSCTNIGCNPTKNGAANPNEKGSYNGKTTCNYGFGNGVILKHTINGETYYTTYGHMRDIDSTLYSGATVSAGQLLGHMGSTGSSTGPHLHFAITKDQAYGNPAYGGSKIPNTPCTPDYHITLATSDTTGLQFSGEYVYNSSGVKYTFGGIPSVNQRPIGDVNECTGGEGYVHVYGWAFDPDEPSKSLDIHVYIGGAAGSTAAICYTGFKANLERTDVNDAYKINGNHGFSFDVYTTLTGTQSVYVYALDTAGGDNPEIEHFTVNIANGDTEKPNINDVQIKDVTTKGFTVSCKATDNRGITSVNFPVWTDNNGQDDLHFYDAQLSNPGGKETIATCYVPTSDHNNEKGCHYTVHIYAYDAAGNSGSYGTGCDVPSADDTVKPTLSDCQITGITTSGFTVSCIATDNVGISSVNFPVWTDNNGKDDLYFYDAQLSNPGGKETRATCYIPTSNHNDQCGCYYTVHIYAYDAAGNSAAFGFGCDVPYSDDTIPPVISNVRKKDLTTRGFTVECDVTDNCGVDSFDFSVWTTQNGQDDLVHYSGVLSNPGGNSTHVSCYIPTSEHNNENGNYTVYLHAYDKDGNAGKGRFYVDVPVTDDLVNPIIENFKVDNITSKGFRITAIAKDDRGINYVNLPVWTNNNGQDDLHHYPGTLSNPGGTETEVSFYVSTEDHNGEVGCEYTIHIYAYDDAWNYYCKNKIIYVPTPAEEHKHSYVYTNPIPATPFTDGMDYSLVCSGCGDIMHISKVIKSDNVIDLPSSIRIISDSAFQGGSMMQVNVPNSVLEIDSDAFAECKNLCLIIFDGTETKISENAFTDTNNICFICDSGSTAAQYANQHGIICFSK